MLLHISKRRFQNERAIYQAGKKRTASISQSKKEIVRDLNEIFSSAAEHDETEQQVIERLGTPKEFADNTAEQFGVDNAISQKRKDIISIIIAFLIAIISFVVYFSIRSAKSPNGAIGQADAMTNIQIESTFGFDVLHIILAIGAIATVFAVTHIILTTRKNRR